MHGAYWHAASGGTQGPDLPRPASPRDPRTFAFVVVGVAAIAVIAVAVIAFVVVRRNDGSRPAAAGSAVAGTATAPGRPSSSSTPSPTQGVTRGAAPATVTVVRSAAASAGRTGGATQQAPRTTSSLRSLYDSATPVDPTSYGNSDNAALSFTSHSGNIECSILTGGEDPVSAQCVIGTYDFPQPGPDCDDGAVVTIDGYGNATYTGCSSVPFSTSSVELPYGASIAAGEFGCTDGPVGVSCIDLATNTGFTLSRQQFVPVS